MLSCSNNNMNNHNLHSCNCTNQYIFAVYKQLLSLLLNVVLFSPIYIYIYIVSEGSDVCMNDCNSEGQRQATQYELMCCDTSNLGNFIKFQEDNHRIRYISCPLTIPDWCSYYEE